MATTLEPSHQPLSQEPPKVRDCQLPSGLDRSSRLSISGNFWHRSAPRILVSTQDGSDGENAWIAWRRHLESRNRPAAPSSIHQKVPALLWGISPALGRKACSDWLGDFRSASKQERISPASIGRLLANWLTSVPAVRPNSLHALQSLAIAYELPRLARSLSDSLWWAVADYLFSTACDAQHAAILEPQPLGDVLAQQWLVGELPMALALQFPEIEPLRGLRKTASNALSESILEFTDGEGILRCELLPIMRPLLACWTRVALFGRTTKKVCWTAEAQTQYEWMIRQAIRFSRSDGSPMLADESQSEWSPMLFATALDLAGDDSDCAAADALLPGKIIPADADFDDDDLPEPSVHSEWSGLAVLATSWSKGAPRLAIAYGQQPPQLELQSGRQVLLCGNWNFELFCDGKRVRTIGEWDEQCWLSDEDCDFLELAVELEHGLRLERQALLAREDDALYLADYIHGKNDRSYEFQFSLQLPLGDDVQFVAEKETRDGFLVGAKPRAAVLPIALPEWRTDLRIGEMSVENGALTITHRVIGKRFCCPIFFDLKPRRIGKQRTWRQLTVAESLSNVPADVAVGFRIQCGRHQWLIYRSLAPAGNRTVLGQNLSSEFLAGRFLATGEVDEFIEIEDEEQ